MRKAEIQKECKTCEVNFTSWECHNKQFCSHECYWKAMKTDKEYKSLNLEQLISYNKTDEARMLTSERFKGKKAWNKGKKMPQISGDKHYSWIKDRDMLVKSEKKHLDGRYRGWMLGVKSRDDWKCKMSNSDCDGRLETHHILNWVDYPELRYQLNNGITLCHAHHPRGRAKEKRLVPVLQELVSVSSEQ